MKKEKLEPPQPIPYPRNWAVKQMYRTPILFYRLGLEKLIGKFILILTTYGRNTGQVHRTPIEYFRHQGQLYVMSGFGSKPDWYKNIKANPHVTINTHQGVIHAIARKPTSEDEWEGAVAFLAASPVSNLSEPELAGKPNQSEILEQIKSWPVLTFDPTDEVCPPALEEDLVWAWFLIFFAFAFLLMGRWLKHRQQ